MANWKVIALVSGNIEAVSGPGCQGRPGAHEWIVWQGAAADKAEALQTAQFPSQGPARCVLTALPQFRGHSKASTPLL